MMKRIAPLAVLASVSLFAIGCGGGGYKYEPPVNTGAGNDSGQVDPDAGVATDEAVMTGGAATNRSE